MPAMKPEVFAAVVAAVELTDARRLATAADLICTKPSPVPAAGGFEAVGPVLNRAAGNSAHDLAGTTTAALVQTRRQRLRVEVHNRRCARVERKRLCATCAHQG